MTLGLASAFVDCEKQDRLTALRYVDALVFARPLNRCQQAGPMLGNSINPSQQLFPISLTPFHFPFYLYFHFHFQLRRFWGNEGTWNGFSIIEKHKVN